MKHNFQHTFQNITISPLKEEHIESMRILRNNNRHCFVYSEIISEEAQQKWFDNYLKKENDYVFSVFLQDMWIGVCSIYDVTDNDAEFGRLIIDKSKTSEKRLGVNTTLCACNLAFEKLNINRIRLQVYENNISAYKTYINAGFTPYKTELDDKNQKLICMELNK